MKNKNFFHSDGRRFFAILIATILLYQISLALLMPPIAWVFVSFAMGAVACCIWIKKQWVTYAAITATTLFLFCAVAEVYLESLNPDGLAEGVMEGDMRSVWQHRLPDLGYAPPAEALQTRGILRNGDKIIYDVNYTSNEEGWRITPVHPQATKAVVFFGCSFTIGQGVNDKDTYPYKVGQMLGTDYQVFNYGFHGYGTHQFLSFLESGRLDPVLKKFSEVHVFFLNIAGHELRSAGFSVWDRFGPRYVLKEGKAVRNGNFHPLDTSGVQGFLREEVRKTLYKSWLFRRIFDTPRERDRPAMLTLQCAILERARELLREKKPSATFTVLTYPSAQGNMAQFQAAGLEVLDTTAFFPQSPSSPQYSIQGDGHPTPLAYTLLAEGLTTFIQHGCVLPQQPSATQTSENTPANTCKLP